MRTMRGLADRMLERLVPRETAAAASCPCNDYFTRCISGSCSSYSNYTQMVCVCNLNDRTFLRCGCR